MSVPNYSFLSRDDFERWLLKFSISPECPECKGELALNVDQETKNTVINVMAHPLDASGINLWGESRLICKQCGFIKSFSSKIIIDGQRGNK